jgi:hypothetical protein
MATAKKTTKTKSIKLIWKALPDGGQYAPYKLGTIRRFKGKYSYSTSYNNAFSASSLAVAKKKIDIYTKSKQ